MIHDTNYQKFYEKDSSSGILLWVNDGLMALFKIFWNFIILKVFLSYHITMRQLKSSIKYKDSKMVKKSKSKK